MSKPFTLPWDREEWWNEVQSWVTARIQEQGGAVTGPLENIHQRPWSAVLRVPATFGIVYFKATAPHLTAEVPLTQALLRWHSDPKVPRVLAADLEQG